MTRRIFGQAARSSISGGSPVLYVHRIPCPFCRRGFGEYARNLGLDELVVRTPQGRFGSYSSAIGRFGV